MHFFHILAHTHNKKQATHKSFLFHSFILFKCKRNDDRQSSKMHFLVSICTLFLKYLDRSRHQISIHRNVKFTKKCKNGLYSSLIFSWCGHSSHTAYSPSTICKNHLSIIFWDKSFKKIQIWALTFRWCMP